MSYEPLFLEWHRDLSEEWLSPPAVGDLDGDGIVEVVVTTQWLTAPADSLLVLDVYTGEPKPGGVFESANSCCQFFRNQYIPPAGPALADLDGADGFEIVVPGIERAFGQGGDLRAIRVHVFDYVPGTGLSELHADASIPFNYRNDDPVAPGYADIVHPVGTPIVGDFDYDGVSYKPDIIVTASNGAIYAFEYDADAEGDKLTAKNGWPILLPDVPREPVLCQLVPGSSQYSLVVQSRDGWLHVFDLPMGEGLSPERSTWPSYGGDPGNTRGRVLAPLPNPRPQVDTTALGLLPAIRSIGPVPSRAGVQVLLATRGGETIRLEFVDVTGRVVRRIVQPQATPGSMAAFWDGRDESGRRLPSGVYWCVLRTAGAKQKRRMVLLH